MANDSYKVVTGLLGDGRVFQELNYHRENVVTNVTREILDIKEVQTRAMLIQMGWTPPSAKEGEEQALFERWASSPIRADKLPLDRHEENGGYVDTRTYTAWYAWKARAGIGDNGQMSE